MLDAASQVFGEYGYSGATTDMIASRAGISQAYVVRMFGSKESLFAEAAERALDRVIDTFAAAAARSPHGTQTMQERLGHAYVELVSDRGVLLTVMHLFTLGSHPRFGPIARSGMLRIYVMLRDEAGLEAHAVEAFLARGMLINALLGVDMTQLVDSHLEARDLMTCVFGPSTDEVISRTSE